ncbi:transglycosylase domain-containing protein [Salinarimonas ramus]|uniref:Penicillin-binding protein 1A n=1 Tax=Salinarimonas ramus TaxID=690164 RepID=A0A917Q3Q8_9HYPH|nr:PBP1A family penicillin-binding protein [Salinarimonas ramus]GGK17414.1 penicillin-binding protein 1A [Salinarimonas ramus]
MRFDRRISVWTRIKRASLAFDAWLSASAFDSSEDLKGVWRRFTAFTDLFRARGATRVVLDLASEGVTLGLAGAFVMLGLAIPAFYETQEDWRRTDELAVTFLDRYGQEVGRRGIRHDDSVALDEIPEVVIKAALATEDRRFFTHWGIDPIGTARALVANSREGGVVQGGSTITQQLAKNLFLSNERTLDRKIKEAFLALWLEFQLSKNEILKLYLDRAYMGGGNFGVVAAADFYFGKPIGEVTLAEAAMLAGLFKAPSRYSPHVNLPAARARANDVLGAMVDAGFMSEGQVQIARRNPASAIDRGRETTPDYYLDWAFEQVRDMARDGRFGDHRVLLVKTPLDQAMQRRSELAVEDTLRQNGERYDVAQAAAVLMEPDGAVRAIVGGRDYGQSQFNRAAHARRQPGSSFKPFVYATALSYLPYRPDSTVVDRPICLGNWCPNNYNRSFAGAMPMITALARSINTIPVRLSVEIGEGNARRGRARIIETARAMGVETPLADTSSLPIGASEMTVLDMAAGYAVFANGGQRARPYAAVEVTTPDGEVLYVHDRDEPRPQVLSSRVVGDMNTMLVAVPERGTGRRAALDGIRSAGKTGTTNAYRDAWYAGYTGNFVTAVWFGNDDFTSTNRMTGGSLPAMAFKEIMSFAHRNVEIRPIPGLDGDGPAMAAVDPATTASVDPQVLALQRNTLSRRSFEVINGIGSLFETARAPRGFRESRAVPGAGLAQPAAAGGFTSVTR